MTQATAIQIELPASLRLLAGIPTRDALLLPVPQPATANGAIDALEAAYPALCNTLRNPATGQRRPLVRFFACGQDISHQPLDTPLPEATACGDVPLLILGAIAGG